MPNTDQNDYLRQICKAARASARSTAAYGGRGAAVERINGSIAASRSMITEANAADLDAAEEAGLDARALSSLRLDGQRLDSLCEWLTSCARLPDMAGEGGSVLCLPAGGTLNVARAPLGAVAFVYDCRPDMTVRSAAAAVLTRNAAILYGGPHSVRTDAALIRAIHSGLVQTGISPDSCVLIDPAVPGTPEILAGLCGIIDLLISNEQRGRVSRPYPASGVPVLITAAGKPHMYVDNSADTNLALRILCESIADKKHYEGSIGTLLLHKDAAASLLSLLPAALDLPLEYRGCPKTREFLPDAVPVVREDWSSEYEEGVLSIKVVENIDDAVSHINCYGTRCCECIVSRSAENIRRFKNDINAAVLAVNTAAALPTGVTGQFTHSPLPPSVFFPAYFPSLLMTDKYTLTGEI